MFSVKRLLGLFGLGAGLMYLMDPARGARRRALIRDKVVAGLHETEDAIGKTARDTGNRARGLMAETRSRFRSEDWVDDGVLVERVRSKIGRYVSHPGAIEVEALGGRVTLRGPVLADEVDDLLMAVESVRGVDEVEDQLEVHPEPGNVPGLQGQPRRTGESFEYAQENWSPAARFVAGTAGAGLALLGLKRMGALGTAALAIGTGLMTRGVSNRPMRRLTGVGAGRRAVDIHKTITVGAPVDEVYDFWSRWENFPRFMTHIEEVRDIGGGRSRWTAKGPAGAPISWNAIVTAQVPGEVLAWRSEPGSTVENAGIVRFEPVNDDTRIDVRLSYNPPAGALGDAVANLFGVDPKSAMDDDLVRLKSLIEEGRATSEGETIEREEVDAPSGHRTRGGDGQGEV